MTEKQFIKQAEECGYSDEEIQELVDLHKETGMKYEEIALLEQTY